MSLTIVDWCDTDNLNKHILENHGRSLHKPKSLQDLLDIKLEPTRLYIRPVIDTAYPAIAVDIPVGTIGDERLNLSWRLYKKKTSRWYKFVNRIAIKFANWRGL